jgi:carboxyl-terminal processing protease
MRSALQHFTPPLCALTIDLRDNSGGNFDQALRLAGLFLPAGAPLTVYEDRQGRTPLYATEKHVPRQERLTLLINATSASSAELFAGVLHWYHRAELVGTPTAGKRTIQQVVRLDHTHLLFLTTGRFLAPDGLPLAVHGLTPDRAFAGEDIAQLMPPCANSRAPDL